LDHEVNISDSIALSDSVTAEVGKSLPWVVGQFRAALADIRLAEEQGTDIAGPLGTFLERLYGLMEAVPSIKDTGEIRALRFARTRYQHQQASLIYRPDGGGPSTWRPSTQLPRPSDMQRHWNAADAAEYDSLLAGKHVRIALDAAERAVTAAVAPRRPEAFR
jgi:hypothetical protein